MDILCYQIGGLVCGLWKKDVWKANNIKFPVRLRYEDNYFGSLTDCYLTKIAFVPEVLYFYRQNPTSTVHTKNAAYQLDRIQIEHGLLEEVKRRNLFERYYPAWEYIYTFRYAFNTCWILTNTYSHPPIDIMRDILKDLHRNFPEWRKNPYYQAITSPKNKLRNEIMYHFPGFSSAFFPVAKKLKDIVTRRNRQ